jgi:asparagine synthase (glutamine-hydrolysing)
MCGICGAGGPDAGRRVAVMNRRQHHRGPDNSSIAPTAGLTLGNTRLAIIDLSDSGNQPLPSRDGTVVCVFNGEIYNHRLARNQWTQLDGNAMIASGPSASLKGSTTIGAGLTYAKP